jgi:hypothetical protein
VHSMCILEEDQAALKSSISKGTVYMCDIHLFEDF